eukprot:TRINITY_DN54573_c0_g1_i1.p1 TRINITY_DN54573_c0_g1~~TRINITY_DN54573_c0_g1_i1.p1  ORF type:complete len:504 (+),score=77.78 TRINITY_DN54573_c0_g1_i1:24-1535(+)
MATKRMACLAALLLAYAEDISSNNEKPPKTQHYFLPVLPRHQVDGLGGHVNRALPGLDIALAFRMRLVCNPALFFNGKSEDPTAFASILGCVNRSAPSSTSEVMRWSLLTDWVPEESVASLRRVQVNVCNLATRLKEIGSEEQTANEPVVFEFLMTSVQGRQWGALAGPWLRKQYHTVHRERARLAQIRDDDVKDELVVDGEDFWRDVPQGHRVLVHYRTGMWSLMPVHKTEFQTHYDKVSHALGLLEQAGVLARKEDGASGGSKARLGLMAAFIEDDQAVWRTKNELEVLASRYDEGVAVQLLSEKNASQKVSRIVRDMDIMTTADYLITGIGQWSTLAGLLKRGDGVSMQSTNPASPHPRLNNTVMLSRNQQKLPDNFREEAAAQAGRPVSRREIAGLCAAEPKLKGFVEQESASQAKPVKRDAKAEAEHVKFKTRVKKQLQERTYLGPKFPGMDGVCAAWCPQAADENKLLDVTGTCTYSACAGCSACQDAAKIEGKTEL